ncbi:MAG: HTTM domain-containing protein, partial [Myxococcota bacterium]
MRTADTIEERGWTDRPWLSWLFRPVDIAALAVFRVAFGLLMAWDTLRYLSAGWATEHYVEPVMTFRFYGFQWLGEPSTVVMYGLFGLQLVSSVAIGFGLFYRLSCLAFTFAHTAIFLLAAEYYLNHAYLISMLGVMMAVLPAHRALSVDVARRPHTHSNRVHLWAYALLIGLLGVVYTYGAIAKMNPDWMAGEPVRHWIGDRAATAPAPIAEFLLSEAGVYFIAYGGLLFDLLVVPGMLWKKTRPLFVLASATFHLSNAFLFHIGVFPWLMLASTTLFFDLDWPRKIPYFGRAVSDALDRHDGLFVERKEDHPIPEGPVGTIIDSLRRRQWVVAGLGMFFTYQLLMPLRHHLYPSNVAWSEEGHMFSWRMKLRDKGGPFTFRVVDKNTGEQWTVDPKDQLTDR